MLIIRLTQGGGKRGFNGTLINRSHKEKVFYFANYEDIHILIPVDAVPLKDTAVARISARQLN